METLTRQQKYRIKHPEKYKAIHDNANAIRKAARQSKREYVQNIKLKTGCEICGYKKYSGALQFDHIIRSDKYKPVSQMTNDYSLEDIKKEISKCRVLCANCHAEKTGHNKEWISNE